ncbi:MAG: YHS domain-containing protein, partial [Rugosibacter sp.]
MNHVHQPTHPHEPTITGEHKDPVCGMTVVADKGIFSDYQDKRYLFCCAKCKTKFDLEPERYLVPKEPEPAIEGAIYTCPMHPEIRQPMPGICPKCGMALEPEMPSLDDEENPELTDFRHRFWWTLPLTVIVTTLAMAGHSLALMSPQTQNWVELALATPIVLWAGWPFF